MNYAVIRNGIVENVVVWDGLSEWGAPESTEVVSLEQSPAGIGWTYTDGTFTPPPQPKPDPISPLLETES